ncbi:MAG TPA: MASE1 domain-containing protein [Methylomirabilota bacterium]|nr:MASE1 domain-containing protein [Methylomirabilota bacterium]
MRRSIPFVVVLVAYVVVGKIGLHFASVHPSATPLWPPTGIALAALLLAGYRLWPAVFLGAFVVNVTTAGSLGSSLGIASGNTLEAVVGTYLVQRFADGRDAFKQPRTILAFCVLAGLVATAVSATIGVTTLAVSGYAPWARWGAMWLTWWLGDAAGALVVAPFFIVWTADRDGALVRRRLPEAVAAALTIIVVGSVVFGGAIHAGSAEPPLAFVCLPALVWAAYRFGARGAATAVVMLGAIATVATLAGSGPLAIAGRNESLLVVQLFLLTISGTVLPLAAVADELRRRGELSAENARLYRHSEERRKTAEAFLATSRALALSLDMREVADRIVTSVRELLGGTVAIVYRIDAASGAYEALAVAGDAGPAFAGTFTIPAGVGTIGLAVREGRAVATTDLTSDSRIVLTAEVTERLQRAPHRAVLAVPLVSGSTTIGAFLVGDAAGRVFTDEERVVAEAFAQQAAVAIANARRFEEAREREQQLSDFFETAAVALHWVGPDGRILRANRAELELLGYSREEYIGRHIADFHVDAGTIAAILDQLRTGQTIQSCPARLRARDGSIRHVVIDSNVYWVDGRFSHTRCFTRDVTALRRAEEEMARLLAAERRAREEAQRAERQMATLGEIAQSITSSLDLDTVLQRIARGAQELCGSDTAAMFLRDGDSEAMVPRFRVGPTVRAYEGLRILPGQGIGGQVLVTGRPVRSNEYLTDPRVPESFHTLAREAGTVTLMVVPITIRDRVAGLLYISNRSARLFTEQDEAVCMRLAAQAAAAIRNARLFAETQAARAEAEAASRAKDDFLAVLSHELRTPLNAIVGWTRMLRTGTMPPASVDKAIEVIDRNAAAQVQLVEDLLDVSRIVSGTLKIELRPVKLAPILAAAIDAVGPTAERKGVRLVSNIAPTIDCVNADPGRLQQAIWNLLVNAVKFTPPAGVVDVTATTDADTVEVTVTDTGSGIEAATLPHIFERFHQADSSTTRQHGGLGLGLAIVKRIVELHEGTVTAHSDGAGRGSRFTVRLLHTAPPAAAGRRLQAPVRAAPRVRLAGVSVLVVDDDADARELCTRALALYGASVTAADSVASALDRMNAVKPDVVIADIGMPGQDGFDLIRRLRADESDRGRRTCVVALTAYVSVQDRLRILDAGFDAHVGKPFDPDELAVTVHNFIASR